MKIIDLITESNLDKNVSATIVFLGDSVTRGYFRGYVDENSVFHARLKRKLNYLYPTANINMINAGIGATTATFGLERLDRDVLSRNPDLCVVCFGLNDAPYREEGLPRYLNSLKEIFLKVKKFGSEVIFMTPNMMNTCLIDELIEERHKETAKRTMDLQNSGMYETYVKSAVKMAKEMEVMVCDCYSIWKKLADKGVNTTALLSNGINHPREEMHELFANELLKCMFE